MNNILEVINDFVYEYGHYFVLSLLNLVLVSTYSFFRDVLTKIFYYFDWIASQG